MPEPANSYRFGDLLALARRSWTLRMAGELEQRGYRDYRITDAASMRLLLRGPLAVGRLGAVLGVTSQAARKVARGLEQRGYALARSDPDDARKVNVVLTEAGVAYARAVVEVIDVLNRSLAERVDPAQLAVAGAVLRVVIGDDDLVRPRRVGTPVDPRAADAVPTEVRGDAGRSRPFRRW